ncbi:magnesium transporter [Pelagibaculum spongiae]|uniref:Magnesium transporter MgtE n=1 Tax=Pelagibaculum spongiae TaxID=2080658 RepID=A0A2V1H411_9GAMM|nr:magnesium transporter [Pelagibaculum spongiae]PVZ71927.1 magnesium transporter [Pelagibaculum spongiae]
MPESIEKQDLQLQLQAVHEALDSGAANHARQLLAGLDSSEVAHLLESMPGKPRKVLWELLSEDFQGDVLQYLGDEVRQSFLSRMQPDEVAAVIEGLETDDIADILQELPDQVFQQVLLSMDEQNRQRLQTVLSFPEDTAGGLMNTDTITVRPDVTLEVVLRYLRLRGELPEATDSLFVVDSSDRFVGVLPLANVLTRHQDDLVRSAMRDDIEAIPADTDAQEVATLFERRDLISAAVIDDEDRLLGRITIDDVVDVIRDEAEHSLLSSAGLDEDEDTFAPVGSSARRRALWLGVNLLTALMASAVIKIFEPTIQAVAGLAVLMPIIASMGGIAGSQTLTLVVRGMALGRIGDSNARWMLGKEMAVGALNGLLWALVVGGVAAFWYDDYALGGVMAMAMLINLSIAAAAGVLLPIAMEKANIDPALAGSMALTTVTDVVGFFSFLGLATLLLI